jgi:hypothetical protein
MMHSPSSRQQDNEKKLDWSLSWCNWVGCKIWVVDDLVGRDDWYTLSYQNATEQKLLCSSCIPAAVNYWLIHVEFISNDIELNVSHVN